MSVTQKPWISLDAELSQELRIALSVKFKPDDKEDFRLQIASKLERLLDEVENEQKMRQALELVPDMASLVMYLDVNQGIAQTLTEEGTLAYLLNQVELNPKKKALPTKAMYEEVEDRQQDNLEAFMLEIASLNY